MQDEHNQVTLTCDVTGELPEFALESLRQSLAEERERKAMPPAWRRWLGKLRGGEARNVIPVQ